MHGFLEIDEFQEMLGKMLRKWLKIVFFKNQEDIRMAFFFVGWIGTYDVFKLEGEYGIHDPALLNNNIWCI